MITSPQGGQVTGGAGGPRQMVNLCANNYLGLADHPEIARRSAAKPLEQYGFGMASVRFICGTLDLHRELETSRRRAISARTTRSCSPPASTPMAALFETAARPEDADHLRQPQPRLDHRRRAAEQGQALPLARPRDMDDLETQLKQAGRRRRPLPADRHRRRVLDGRLYRQAPRNPARWPTNTTPSSPSTIATPPAISAPRAAAPAR